MNRVIRFRGKRTDNGEWVSGGSIIKLITKAEQEEYYIPQKGENNVATLDENGNIIGFENCIFYKVIPETVGQYTGLSDKNDKNIFEGDIIKSCEFDNIYFVKYFADDNYPAFDVVPEMNVECNGFSHLHIVEGIEVIGNIHDNPELLNK